MSPTLQNFLKQQLPRPGLAAWVTRLADHSLAHQTYVEWFTPGQLEQLVKRLVQVNEQFARHQIRPAHCCWVFEHARLHLAGRPDGTYLALFAENSSDVPTEPLTQVLADFLALHEL